MSGGSFDYLYGKTAVDYVDGSALETLASMARCVADPDRPFDAETRAQALDVLREVERRMIELHRLTVAAEVTNAERNVMQALEFYVSGDWAIGEVAEAVKAARPAPTPEPQRLMARAPVQGNRSRREPPGSVDWDVHMRAFAEYARRFGNSQSAERIAARGGFDQSELRCLLAGHDPIGCRTADHAHDPIPTWRPLDPGPAR